jgi:hypothetical protein
MMDEPVTQADGTNGGRPERDLPWSEMVRLFPWVTADIERKPDIKQDATAWLREIRQCLWNATYDLECINVEYVEEQYEEDDVDVNDQQAVKEHLDIIVDGARHDWGKAMQPVGELAAILFDARHEILDAADLRDVHEILMTAYGLLIHICHLWDELDENSDFRNCERKWLLSDLEYAIDEMKTCAREVTRQRHRLEECVMRLDAYVTFHTGYSTPYPDRSAHEIDALLDKDIVQAIIKTLGTQRLARGEIANRAGYEDAGHLRSTLADLKRAGVLRHVRPWYSVSRKWYSRFGICPDKDGQ